MSFDFSQYLFDELYKYGDCCEHCAYFNTTKCRVPYKTTPINNCYKGVKLYAKKLFKEQGITEVKRLTAVQATRKRLIERKKTSHICLDCGKIDERTLSGRTRCKECAEKDCLKAKAYYKQKRELRKIENDSKRTFGDT